MKVENIKKDIIFKSYKHMCEVLELKVTSGNSKVSQFKELDRYCRYHKEGNKIIIDEVYEEIKSKDDNRIEGNNSLYGKYIQKLILDLLSQEENNGQVFLSCNQLLRKFQMVSQNYAKGKQDIPTLAEILKVKEEVVKDVYSYTHTKLKSALEGALNSLEKQSWIMWNKKKTVCIKKVVPTLNELGQIKLDLNGDPIFDITEEYREATLQECQEIIKYEGLLLDELQCKDKREVIIKDKMDYFRKEVNKQLREHCNIEFYYDSYEIITHKKALLERLGRFEKVDTYDVLNKTIIEQTYKSIETKHNNACDKVKNTFGKNKSYDNATQELRADEKYCDMSKLVSDKILPRKARKINGLWS